MIIIKSLYNNTITKLSLYITLHIEVDIYLVIAEAEKVISMRKLSNTVTHIIDFELCFTLNDSQGEVLWCGTYKTEQKNNELQRLPVHGKNYLHFVM